APALRSGKTRKGEAIMFAPRWMMQARQRFHSPRLRGGFTLLRPRLEELENRCLPSGAGWVDAPLRRFDTGYFPQGFGPNSLALGDLDADGDPDAVVGNYYYGGPGLSVLKNKGDGTYGPPQIIKLPLNQSVGDVALADVDKDGDLDALATIPDANGLTNQ